MDALGDECFAGVAAVAAAAVADARNIAGTMKNSRNSRSLRRSDRTFPNIHFRHVDDDSSYHNNALETWDQNIPNLHHHCPHQTRSDSIDYGDFERRSHCNKFDSVETRRVEREHCL